jgi:uncharacterized membrane protein YkoI
MVKYALYVAGLLMACLSTRNSPERLLKEAKISLPEAVEKALPEIKDGNAVSARLREEKSRILYIVNIAQGETTVRMSIDAKTQEVVEKTTLKKNYTKLIGGSKITLAKAVSVATEKVAGKATRVSFGLKKNKPVAEVIVFKDGKLFEVKLDAVTGSVIKVEEDDDDDDDGDDDDGDDEDDDD